LSDETVEKLNRLKQLLQKNKNDEVLNFALDCAIKNLSEKPIKQSKSSPIARVASGNLRREVLKRDSHKCQYPGCDETKYLHLDHQVPFTKGGLTTSSNLKVLCSTHNRLKGARKA
jgi:selenocysteine-specific translation elongation factor